MPLVCHQDAINIKWGDNAIVVHNIVHYLVDAADAVIWEHQSP